MKRSNSLVIVCLVMLVAFFSGYRKDSLGGNFSAISSWFGDQMTGFTSLFISEEPAPKEKAFPEKPAPAVATKTPTKQGFPLPQPRTAAKPPTATQSGNPYQRMMKAQQQSGSLSKTFESIKQGKIGERQTQKRNLYFEKLSEQMRKLKGEVPTLPEPVEVIPPGNGENNIASTNPPKLVEAFEPEENEIDELDTTELEDELDVAEAIEEEHDDEALLADVLNELNE